ncbi:hypothetical protein KAM334_20060 [Aeromonas caviae]|nr:hypothetical protein KAM334_20060 [Aeromonas caviae]
MRQKQVKKGPDKSGPAAGDQNGRAGTFQCKCRCVCELIECKASIHSFYPPCYLTHMPINRIKPIINAVRVNI